MTAYKKTMREALQEVSSFKVKKEEKENQSFIGPEPLPDFDDEGEEVNTTPHEVELDEAKMSSKQIAALKKAYEPMRGGRLSMDNATKLGNLMDRFDKDKDLLIQLFKADIPFVSKIAMTRLISKHKMKGAELNKLADKDEFYRKMYGESLDEDGHTDVASAIRQCKTVMEDAQQIMAKLQTMSPEDSLPTWWTNKFAVASNSMNKMRDYIVNPLGEALDKEDEPTVKKVVKMLKKASGAHAGQAKDLEKAVKEDNELDEGKMSQLHQMMKDGKSAEEIAKAMKLDLKTIKALTKEEVVLDEKIAGLVKKSKQTGVPYGILKKSYDRGIAAWRTGHRPGTTPQQWAFARVNSMLTGGKADPDLQPKARAAKKAKKASAKKEEFSVIDEKRHMDPADIDTSATDDDIKAADKNIMMQMRKAVSLRGQHPVEFMDKKKVKIPQKLAMAVIAKYNKQPKPMDKEKFQSKIAKSYKALLTTMKEQKEESLLDRLNRKILENSNG